jgi:hypothetical protein
MGLLPNGGSRPHWRESPIGKLNEGAIVEMDVRRFCLSALKTTAKTCRPRTPRLTYIAPDRAQRPFHRTPRFQRATGELVSLGVFDATVSAADSFSSELPDAIVGVEIEILQKPATKLQ